MKSVEHFFLQWKQLLLLPCATNHQHFICIWGNVFPLFCCLCQWFEINSSILAAHSVTTWLCNSFAIMFIAFSPNVCLMYGKLHCSNTFQAWVIHLSFILDFYHVTILPSTDDVWLIISSSSTHLVSYKEQLNCCRISIYLGVVSEMIYLWIYFFT